MVHTIEDLTTTVNTLKRDKSELEMQVQHVHQLEKEQKINIRKLERLTTGTLKIDVDAVIFRFVVLISLLLETARLFTGFVKVVT